MDTLVRAGERVLGGYKDKRQHLLAIAFVSVGVLVESRTVGIGQTSPTLGAMLTVAFAENPNYCGHHKMGGQPSLDRLHPTNQPIREVQRSPKPGRNDVCPCGSGKKFKRCHGV